MDRRFAITVLFALAAVCLNMTVLYSVEENSTVLDSGGLAGFSPKREPIFAYLDLCNDISTSIYESKSKTSIRNTNFRQGQITCSLKAPSKKFKSVY